VSPSAVIPSSDLADRQRAIAAAFRSARSGPHLQSVTATPSQPSRPATSAPTKPEQQFADVALLEAMRGELRRLTERLERLENKVDLIDDGEPSQAPLAWPVDVESDNRLEVPPFEVRRSNSPAFDVLLGPARRDSA
jgi:hypothetical protein